MNPEDDENPRWTKEDFATARPAREVVPPEVADQLVARREGADLMKAFRAAGPLLGRRRFAPYSLQAAA